MLSHCFMPGFLLILLFSSWTYRLALRRMLKNSLSVYQSHIYRKLTFRLPSQSFTSLCRIQCTQRCSCLWDGSLFCTLWPGHWRRIHNSLSPRESCIKINAFYVNNQANDKISARLEAIVCFPVIEFFIKCLSKINVNSLSLRHLFVSFVKS